MFSKNVFFSKTGYFCKNNSIDLAQSKIPKSTSAFQKNPRTFRMARIDPSRQGVMTQAIFVRGDINF